MLFRVRGPSKKKLHNLVNLADNTRESGRGDDVRALEGAGSSPSAPWLAGVKLLYNGKMLL